MSLRRRERLAGAVVIAVALLAAGSAAAHEVLSHASAPAARAGQAAGGEAGIRNLAAAWVASQVSRAAIVSCDPVMCDALRARGFPVSDLMELNSGGAALLRSAVVVATADIRSEIGGALSSAYAPDVIARFGTGAGQIDIRTVAMHGAATYEAQLSSDQQQRRESGAELLTSDRLVVAPAARPQLLAGQVDSRVLVTIAALGGLHPIEILGFGDSGPGATPGSSPLRSAEFTQAPGGRQLAGPAFLRSTVEFLRQQHNPFYASGVQEVRLGGGKIAIRVVFSAPSPLGLLSGSFTSASGG